jgi:geranylgeranyl diphosphate synthase, type II
MASPMDFKEKLLSLQHEAEDGIRRLVPAADTRPARLHAAMRYSLEAGGKRLRPVIALAAAELRGARAAALPAAVALECIHTYSLIHDDLPAMDDDDLRRGRPTCHRQFDEATAILAGDALLTHAFALVGEAYADRPALGIALVRELGLAAGSARLVGGQMEDIQAEGRTATADEVEFIHAGKTAALITAAAVCGGLVGGAPAGELVDLRVFGHHLGLAFQMVDDILDATSTSEALGKTAGKDAQAGKATIVALRGLEHARRLAAQHTAAALEITARLPGDTSFLAALVRSLEHRAS